MCLRCIASMCKLAWDFDYNSSCTQRVGVVKKSCYFPRKYQMGCVMFFSQRWRMGHQACYILLTKHGAKIARDFWNNLFIREVVYAVQLSYDIIQFEIFMYVCSFYFIFFLSFFLICVLHFFFLLWWIPMICFKLSHLPLMPHICVSEIGHHWFR